jgi:hypothetical protein
VYFATTSLDGSNYSFYVFLCKRLLYCLNTNVTSRVKGEKRGIIQASVGWDRNYEFRITQHRLCSTYNVTLRCVLAAIAVVDKTVSITQPDCVCICSIGHPACNTHAPYFHLWPAPVYDMFSTLSHKRHDFRKTVTEYKRCVLISSTTFVWNISHSKKKCERYDQKCISVFM